MSQEGRHLNEILAVTVNIMIKYGKFNQVPDH